MAKLVVFAYDIPGEVSYKRGDVVSVREDDAPLGGDVENGVDMGDGTRKFLWRVVSVSGAASEYEHLIEPGHGSEDETKTKSMRTKRVDLDLIEGAASGKKGEAIVSGETVVADKEGINSVTFTVPVTDKPMVIG